MDIKNLNEKLDKVLKSFEEAKNGKFVGRENIFFTDEQIAKINDLFKVACDKYNLSYELKRKEGSGKPYDKGETLEVTINLPFEGNYRNSDSLSTMNVRGTMTFLVWNEIGITQKGSSLDTDFDWDEFKKQTDNKEYWKDQQFSMKSYVNMSTRDYRTKNWYGSSIETYDYDDNLVEIGIEKAIDRAMDILSRAKKIKG